MAERSRSNRADNSDTTKGSTDTSRTSETAAEAKDSAEQADSAVSEQVNEAVKVETDQGFRGVEVDPTPNENYTLAGQNAGAPVPETDEEAAEAARLAQVEAGKGATGVAGR